MICQWFGQPVGSRPGIDDDAADVVQDVFVRLARSTATLAGVREPLSYLRRMTHRAAIDLYRRRARRPEESLEPVRFVEAEETSPERKLDAERVSRAAERVAGFRSAKRGRAP